MSDFFPQTPVAGGHLDEDPQPVWLGPPEDVLPGVVPVELVIGQSDTHGGDADRDAGLSGWARDEAWRAGAGTDRARC